MPVNKSTNKVRVTRLFGAGATVGFVDPQVNMRVRNGIDSRWIVALDSGNFQVSLGLASGGAVKAKAYPHDLTIDAPQASGFGWPAGTGSTTLGHNGTHSIGTDDPTDIYVLGGDGVVTEYNR
jgi:hypothetical protein